VPKQQSWLLSVLACIGFWSLSLPPVRAQVPLPYALELDLDYLEEQGRRLAQDAVQLLRFQQPELALQRAELATQLAPNRFESWFILGTLYVQEDRPDAAIAALETARDLAPDEAGIHFTLGRAYFLDGQYEAAVREIRVGLDIDPETPEAYFDLGNSYMQLRQYGDAVAAFEEAFDLNGEFWPAINNIGLIRYEQGDVDDAIALWQQAVDIEPASEPQLAIAVALYQRGETRQGIELGSLALESDSRYGELEFLAENLWGEKLLADTREFFLTPTMRDVLTRLQVAPPTAEASPQ